MPDVHALTEEQSKIRTEAFRDAEGSLRFEGLDPTPDARYQAIKSHLVAGTLTFDEAEVALKAQYGVRGAASFAASA